jgi:hypothetical protein
MGWRNRIATVRHLQFDYCGGHRQNRPIKAAHTEVEPMKTFTEEQLQEILQKHKLWLDGKKGGECADLRYADLRCANFREAVLRYANFNYADLREANFSYADLRGADFSYANFREANLRCADFRYANLLAVGNMVNIKSVQADIWHVAYTHDTLQIGCQHHLITEWWAFEDEEIDRMDRRALAWWAVWKPILRTIIAASPAEPTGFVEGDQE